MLQTYVFGIDCERDVVAQVNRGWLIVIRQMGEMDERTVSRESTI